jgi:hypothetical protein
MIGWSAGVRRGKLFRRFQIDLVQDLDPAFVRLLNTPLLVDAKKKESI